MMILMLQLNTVNCLTVEDVNPASGACKTVTSLKGISPLTVQHLN